MLKECAIIDTCVLLSDPDVIVRAAQIGFPVVTKTVFDEIDYNKKNSNVDTAKNASSIFRKIKHQTPEKLKFLPCGKTLRDGDTLYKYEFDGAPLFALSRNQYRTKRTEFNDVNTYNDATIREVAKDYDLILVTEDGGNKTLADIDGIRAAVWVPQAKKKRPTRADSVPSTQPVRPFKRATSLTDDINHTRRPQAIPGEGDIIKIGSSGPSVFLARQIGEGGEGQVFEIAGDNRIAKIYHGNQLTANRIAKLELMASRAVSRKGICWPEQLIYTPDGCAVGYVMQRAHGHPLQKSVFVKPLLVQRFPQWQRENLVNVCISFVEHLAFLHSLNVLVGDINPMNILVDGDGTDVFIVDTDSFQVEGFPCPVGTVNFSPPQLQNKNFKSCLRGEDDELFAIATMLFMILVPGKPPYSQQGGESPEKNIIDANFPYPLGDDHKSKNVAPGPWRYIWSHLPYRIKELFHKAFRENQRIAIADWLDALRAYKNNISKDYVSNEIFPGGFKVPKGQGVNVTCTRQGCGKTFEIYRDKVGELNEKGQSPICPECLRVMELERLARTSAAATDNGTHKASATAHAKTVFSSLRQARTNKSSGTVKATTGWSSTRPKATATKQSTKSDAGLKSVAVVVGILLLLGLTVGWWVVPIILIALLILGLMSGKIPR